MCIQEEYSLTVAILVALSGLTTGSIYDIAHECKKGGNCNKDENSG